MRHPVIIRSLALMLAKRGVPYADIQRETGLPSSTLSKWAIRAGHRRHKSPTRDEDHNLKLF